MEASGAGAVDQDVEAAERVDRLFGDLLRAFQGARVPGDELRALRGFLVRVAGGDDNRCAAVEQALRGSRADAARPAGDEGALAGKFFGEIEKILDRKSVV